MPSYLVATVANVALLSIIVIALAGAGCVVYGVFLERRWYRRAGYRLRVLPPSEDGPGATTLLHLSDLHFVRRDVSKARFLGSLGKPDVTVVTGDILGEPEAVEAAVAALRPCRGRLASYFVLGSNDYFAPEPANYAMYFLGKRRHRAGTRGRAGELVAALERDGWTHLKNRRVSLTHEGARFEVMGMDDPHIERHDLRVASRVDPGVVGIAVVHSPDPAPELAALGYELILAGHTHGGQVRFPIVGALVTNGHMPTRLCMGLSRLGASYMHVSPGLGTSKYAPFRFLCRPEATTLELVPAPAGQPSASL